MGQLGRRRASRVEVADPGKFNPKQLKPRRFHSDDACDGTYVGSSTKTAKVLGLLDLGFTVQGHTVVLRSPRSLLERLGIQGQEK